MPKRRLRGPQHLEQKTNISIGQKRRWADPDKRILAIRGIVQSWQSGALSKYRYVWNDEADALLRHLKATLKSREFRKTAARMIGVCDRSILERADHLGLIDTKLSAKVKLARAFNKTPEGRALREAAIAQKAEKRAARQAARQEKENKQLSAAAARTAKAALSDLSPEQAESLKHNQVAAERYLEELLT